MTHMKSNILLSKFQHGFIKGCSCTTHLLTPSTVDVIYFDFAKAFDTIPHSRLVINLHGYGIHCAAAEWV